MSAQAYDRANYQEVHSDPTLLATVLKRTSWGAVVAGAVAAITVQMLLSVLGIAIGVTSANLPASLGGEAGSGITIAAGVWWLVTGVISLFVGGGVVGRLAGMTRSTDVLLHAFTMWGVTALFGFLIVGTGAGALYGLGTNASYTGASSYTNNQADPGAGGDYRGQTDTASPVTTADQQHLQSLARTASWWTLFGLLFGVGGSLAGCWMATPRRIVLTSPTQDALLGRAQPV